MRNRTAARSAHANLPVTLLVAWTLLFAAALQGEGGVTPPARHPLPKPPELPARIEVDGGLTARSGDVVLHLPLPKGPNPAHWLEMAQWVGMDVAAPEFAGRLADRARELRRDFVARRRRAAQEQYDAVNAANSEDPRAIHSDAMRPQVHALVAWALKESRRSIEIEAESWARAVEMAAIASGQGDAVDHERFAAGAAMMARELMWRSVIEGPAPIPGGLSEDLERSLGPRAGPCRSPECAAALQAYRQRGLEVLQATLKSFEAFFQSSAGASDATRVPSAAALGRVLDAQIAGVESIAQALGDAGPEWRYRRLTRIHGSAEPLLQVQWRLSAVAESGVGGSDRQTLDDLIRSVSAACTAATQCFRTGCMALFTGREWRSETAEEDYSRCMREELRNVLAALATALAALRESASPTSDDSEPGALHARVADAAEVIGSVSPDGTWHSATVNPEWPATVLQPTYFRVPKLRAAPDTTATPARSSAP